MPNSGCITSVAWVRRGVPALKPSRDVLVDEPDDDDAAAAAALSDDDDDADNAAIAQQDLAFYRDNREDPHLKAPAVTDPGDDDDDSEAGDDFTIQPTDLVLIGARSDDEMSSVEMYVYEEQHDNLYPHHDIPLPVFPLCLAACDFRPGVGVGAELAPRANMLAVGTFAPHIEIWDMDVLDALEPVAVLGAAGIEAAAAAAEEEEEEAPAKKKKKKKGGGGGGGASSSSAAAAPAGVHTDAVMALAWNPLQRNLLISGSADTTVRLWDLTGSADTCVQTLRHHTDKVQALAWHPTEAPVLLSAAFDKKAALLDVRAPDAVRTWALTADVERVVWNPHDPNYFVASAEDGTLRCFDARSAGGSGKKGGGGGVWSVQAHEGAVSGLDFCPSASDVVATGSVDKTVKLWSVTAGAGAPEELASRDLKVGAIFDVRFCPDAPALIAAAGSKGKVALWNGLELEPMQKRLPNAEAALDDDGNVLGGAVAGLGALDVDSEGDDDDGAAAPAGGGGDDDDDDDDDDDSDDDEEEAPRAAPAGGRGRGRGRAGGRGGGRGRGRGRGR